MHLLGDTKKESSFAVKKCICGMMMVVVAMISEEKR